MNLLAELQGVAVRFPLVIGGLLACAWLLGPLAARVLGRWSAGAKSTTAKSLERSAKGSLRLLILLLGADWALSLAPLPPRIESALSGVCYVAAVMVAARLAMRLSALLASGYLDHAAAGPERERAQKEYLPLASTLTTVALSLVAIILVAHHFGHDVSSLVAALGIGSLAIGLAAQQTLGNMIAGFTLLIDRPFRPGDRIRLATGEVGDVQDIGIRSTRILLDDQNLLIVPNADLVNSRVVNFAFPSRLVRGEVRVRVTWRDAERAITLLEALARAQPEVLAEPLPSAAIVTLNERFAEVALRFQVAVYAQSGLIEEQLRRACAGQLEMPIAGEPAARE